jgi:acetate kinase
MNVLVLNCGSATVKYRTLAMEPGYAELARGSVESSAVEQVVAAAAAAGVRIDAVGHRVVHGGERFLQPVRIDEDTLEQLQALSEFAPLHNPASLRGIHAARQALGLAIPQVAVFDTAFHATLPERALHYAVALDWRARFGLRRYGFHGLSHRFVAERYAELRGGEANIVSLHLGNGASACAIQNGHSVDTSMGLTPIEGLMMGSRCGDLDPAAVPFLAARLGVDAAGVIRMLNEESGLLGVSGRSRDMRELLEAESSDPRAALAIEMFCYRARKYVGAYLAALGGASALVFTGGIGERSPEIRSRICAGLEWMGLELDPAQNTALVGREGCLSAAGSRLEAWVIPANEEWVIARDTVACLAGKQQQRSENA